MRRDFESVNDNKHPSIWQSRNFQILLFVTFFSSIGDASYFVLLGWFTLTITGSQLALGISLTCASIPRLIFMLLGGVIADRFNRQTVLSLSLYLRFVILLGFCIFYAHLPHPETWPIYVMAILFGTIDAFYWPASNSIVPSVVQPHAVTSANSVIQTAQQLSLVAGPLLASGLLFLKNPEWRFIFIACLYLFSALTVIFLKSTSLPEQAAKSLSTFSSETSSINTPSSLPSPSMWMDLRNGITYVLSMRILSLMMLTAILINLLFMGPINIGLPVLVRQLGWPGHVYGNYQAALGAGAVIGGMIVLSTHGMRGKYYLLPWLGSLMGISMLGVGIFHQSILGMLMMSIGGVSISMLTIPILNYVQVICEPSKLGRVMSLLTLTSIGLVPVSYTLSSAVLQTHWLSASGLLIICGISLACLLLILQFSPTFRSMEKNKVWIATSKNTNILK